MVVNRKLYRVPVQVLGAFGASCRSSLFVADNLGAPLAVVEVVSDADHAHGAGVVGRGGLDGTSAAHAAQDLDGGDGLLNGVHAGSVA